MVRGHVNLSKDQVNFIVRPPPASEEGSKAEAATPPPPPPPPQSFEYYVSGSVQKLHEETFQKVVELLLKKGVFFNNVEQRKKSPFQFLPPQDLQKKMDFKLKRESLLQPDNPDAGRKELLDYIEFLIDQSPHPSHPFMVSKNSAGLDPYGIVGDWLSTTMSQPVLSYFLAPVFTLMELEVYKEFRNLLGYPKGQGDGIYVPSHGVGNGFAIQMAIQNKYPEVRDKGLLAIGNPRPVIYVSDQADYSFEKYCIWEGLGSDACIRIKTDNKGRMIVNELRNKLKDSKRDGVDPIMVVATAGTNVLGAIDPINEIAQVASDNKLWFHVDGHLAGSCVFSQKHSQRLKGIERSDSCVWSPDKMLAAPFITCIVVTRENKKVNDTFRYDAAYVFEQDPFYDHKKWDTGDSTIQTTRRPDILKIWLMWKVKGRKGLGDQVDGTYRNTTICVNELRSRYPNFVLLQPEFDSNLVCFYYIPKTIRRYLNFNIFGDLTKVNQLLNRNKVTESIKNELLRKGKMVISLGELPGRNDLPKFFVMNMNNTALSRDDIVYMLDLIEYHGDQMRTIIPFDVDTGEEYSLPNEEDLEDSERLVFIEPVVPPRPLTYPNYVSAPIESMHSELFQKYFKTVFEVGTYFQDRRNDSPLHFQLPEVLLQKFNFSLEDQYTAEPNGSYKSVDSIMEIVKGVVYNSARLAHPYYAFQLVSGLDPYTMMADYVAACITSPMYTYEDGPVYTIMEDELTNALIRQAKYNGGDSLAFVGGSLSNELPIFLAYIKKFQNTKEKGIASSKNQGVILVSEAAHYSTFKGAFFQGIGIDNAIMIKTDQTGKMDIKDLRQKTEAAVAKNQTPFMVCATVGTTTLGAYDSLVEVADICKEFGMWLHADGAYGGSVILSDQQWYRLEGIQRSDSFGFNPHKMFCAARYTTNWVTSQPDILRYAAPPPSKQFFGLNPDLYNGKEYDHGETHVLTDRRPDVFKMWFLWKAKGTIGLGQHVDKAYKTTDYAYQQLLRRSRENNVLQPVMSTPPECTNINFFYVPKQLKDNYLEESSRQKITCVQNAILAQLVFNDKKVTSVEAVAKIPPHIIFCLYNTCLNEKDVDYFFDLVEFYGGNLDIDGLFAICAPPPKGLPVEGIAHETDDQLKKEM